MAVNGENQHWTALTYAAAKGHLRCARILLERGASVEGGAVVSEDKITLTPLQVFFRYYFIDFNMFKDDITHGCHAVPFPLLRVVYARYDQLALFLLSQTAMVTFIECHNLINSIHTNCSA